jgi:hypothetical protein
MKRVDKKTSEETDEPLFIATAIEQEFISLRNFLIGMSFVFPQKLCLLI